MENIFKVHATMPWGDDEEIEVIAMIHEEMLEPLEAELRHARSALVIDDIIDSDTGKSIDATADQVDALRNQLYRADKERLSCDEIFN